MEQKSAEKRDIGQRYMERKEKERGAKADIEKLLEEGNLIRIHPKGFSMYPLFVPERDEAVIGPADTAKLKRGDVALYRRESGRLVLHRIWKRRGSEFYMVGDNQKEIEGPLSEGQIKGVLKEVIRRGRRFSVDNPIYRLSAGIWLFFRPIRPFFWGVLAKIRKIKSS